MKRRQLKKSIQILAGELAAECVAYKNFGDPNNHELADNVIKNILFMQNEMIKRISHVEPGCTKLFFKKLKQDIVNQTNDIIDQIMQLA